MNDAPNVPHVLAYHEISDQSSKDVYCITPEVFLRHLWVAQQAAQHSDRPLRITFDDGHASHIRWAVPFLNNLRIQGQFFVPTDWIDSRSGYASWSDLRSLCEQGHRVSSHGATHCFLSTCSPSSLVEELRGSRMTLEDKLGQQATSISMPGGRWNETVLLACGAAGYQEVYTSEPGMSRPATVIKDIHVPAVIGRFAVRRKTSLRTVAEYVEGGVVTVNCLRSMYRLRQLARRLLGDSGYQQLWSSLFRAMPG
jgi:peptidoglycan/xylan/chitin deacetylase (PgdA/CDA1 family)